MSDSDAGGDSVGGAPEAERFPVAPELDTTTWFNTREPVTLESLRGQVVAIEVFQMLCPGCVSHGLPQAQRLQHAFPSEITVLGLHSVFEHHDAMTPVSLEAFLGEYRVRFPVGVDRPSAERGIPSTMSTYELRGTPTLLLIDRAGRLRLKAFGHIEDIKLGAEVQRLVDEPVAL